MSKKKNPKKQSLLIVLGNVNLVQHEAQLHYTVQIYHGQAIVCAQIVLVIWSGIKPLIIIFE